MYVEYNLCSKVQYLSHTVSWSKKEWYIKIQHIWVILWMIIVEVVHLPSVRQVHQFLNYQVFYSNEIYCLLINWIFSRSQSAYSSSSLSSTSPQYRFHFNFLFWNFIFNKNHSVSPRPPIYSLNIDSPHYRSYSFIE